VGERWRAAKKRGVGGGEAERKRGEKAAEGRDEARGGG
jgi:hypothetical protein